MAKQQPRLRIIQEAGESEFELSRDLTRIGRSTEADLIINEKSASRLHAEISNLDGECYVKDLDSRNGTSLNDEKIEGDVRLYDGDEIKIGRTMFIFVDPNAAREIASAFDEMSDEDWEELGASDKTRKPRKKQQEEESLFQIQNLLILVAIVGVVALIGVIYVATLPPEPTAEALEPVELPQPSFMQWGRLEPADRKYAEKVIFSFTVDSMETHELGYKIYDNEHDGEVVIYINNKLFGKAEATANDSWSIKHFVEIYEEFLKEGENLITFENRRIITFPREYWGVSEVTVTTRERFVCDEQEAERNFLLGKERFESRNVSRENLYESMMLLQRAVDSARTCQPRPPFFAELTALFQESRREFEKKMDQLWLSYELAERRRDFEGAVQFLNEVMAWSPDAMSDDFRRARDEMNELNMRR